MTLVDTSVWIEFFRRGSKAARLETLLEDNSVLMHAAVLGELALGSLGPQRRRILADLEAIPPAAPLAAGEVREMIEVRRLHGRGIGWVDVHLLGSALVLGAGLWTLDKKLGRAAAELGIPPVI